MKSIGFVKPWIERTELQQILRAEFIGSLGKISKRLERFFERKFKVKKALLVGSCTDALEISLMSLELKRDDEVICPSYTFVSTVNSIVKVGGKAVFVDIEPNSLGLDPDKVEKAISQRTRAVVLVHYGGIPAQVERIREICVKNRLKLIEDAAQGLFVKVKDQYLGTFGDIGCFSFHHTKNVTCGEGGLLVVTDDSNLSRICEEIRSFGTNKGSFMRGEVDKYEWQRVGGSYFMTELQAALLKTQINKAPRILIERRRVYQVYSQKLKRLKELGIGISLHPSNSNYHLFWLICRSMEERAALLEFLKKNHIQAFFHFLPLHKSPFVKRNPDKFRISGSMEVTDLVSDRILRLPIFPELKNGEVDFICSKILRFYKS
jgi:dTDP-4-amino-4,6-dideoxygalactose transaminase